MFNRNTVEGGIVLLAVLISLVALLALAFGASATTAPTCATEAMVRASISKSVPDAVATEVSPASAYLKEFDKIPPASSTPVPAKLLVFISPKLASVLVMGFHANGCAAGKTELTVQQHDMIMREIEASI
jgi:hypothetical protein